MFKQLSPEIQAIIQQRDQTKSGVNFYFPSNQRKQLHEWKTIKIICENFEIINNQLAIIKPESNVILIHPSVCSFAAEGSRWNDIGCFQKFKIQSIEIPNSIISLSDSCFSGCSSLTQISLPNSTTSLGNSCFYKCEQLFKPEFPNSLIRISDYCFDYSKLFPLIIQNQLYRDFGNSPFKHNIINY
jgi:hypothetical protein